LTRKRRCKEAHQEHGKVCLEAYLLWHISPADVASISNSMDASLAVPTPRRSSMHQPTSCPISSALQYHTGHAPPPKAARRTHLYATTSAKLSQSQLFSMVRGLFSSKKQLLSFIVRFSDERPVCMHYSAHEGSWLSLHPPQSPLCVPMHSAFLLRHAWPVAGRSKSPLTVLSGCASFLVLISGLIVYCAVSVVPRTQLALPGKLVWSGGCGK